MINYNAKAGVITYRFQKERMDVTHEQEETPRTAVDLCAGACPVRQSSGEPLQHQFLGNKGLPH